MPEKQMEDASEFLIFVLAQLVLQVPELSASLEGKERADFQCSCCPSQPQPHRINTFTSISLSLPVGPDQISISSLLEQYFAVETIKKKCDNCAEDVDTERTDTIQALPTILHIQLKRFETIGDAVTKNEISVQITPELNLKQFIHPDMDGYEYTTGQYVVKAVVSHLGSSVNVGHYTACVKRSDGEWYRTDDAETVSAYDFPQTTLVSSELYQCS